MTISPTQWRFVTELSISAPEDEQYIATYNGIDINVAVGIGPTAEDAIIDLLKNSDRNEDKDLSAATIPAITPESTMKDK